MIGSALGGLLALAGVALAQGATRRTAREDRLWKDRSTAYIQLAEWATAWIHFYVQNDAPSRLPAETGVPPNITANILIHGSQRVLDAVSKFEEFQGNLFSKDGVVKAAATGDEWTAMGEQAGNILGEIFSSIRAETRR